MSEENNAFKEIAKKMQDANQPDEDDKRIIKKVIKVIGDEFKEEFPDGKVPLYFIIQQLEAYCTGLRISCYRYTSSKSVEEFTSEHLD